MKKVLIFLCINLIFCNLVCADDNLDFEDISYFPTYEVSSSSTLEPRTYSKNIIIIDRKTLIPLYEKNAYTKVAMASTTKIMTCIIALENCSNSESVRVSKKASSINGSTLGLVENMEISLNDLLYGLMLRSGNDCAIAIAEHISGSVQNFSILMNQKARELGLFNTNFVTPHGLDDSSHFTTAYDLAILTNYALKNSNFKKIVSTQHYIISFNGSPREITNTNELLGNLDGVYGVKTGFTFEAGRCLVSSCKRNDLDIIVVVLGADSKKLRTLDSTNLINYVFDNFNYVDISLSIDEAFLSYLDYFKSNCILEKTSTLPVLKLNPIDNYSFPFSKSDSLKLNTKIYTLNSFSPSISPNSIVGKLYVYNDKTLLCSLDIILENSLLKNDWKYYFKEILKNHIFLK